MIYTYIRKVKKTLYITPLSILIPFIQLIKYLKHVTQTQSQKPPIEPVPTIQTPAQLKTQVTCLLAATGDFYSDPVLGLNQHSLHKSLATMENAINLIISNSA